MCVRVCGWLLGFALLDNNAVNLVSASTTAFITSQVAALLI